MESIEKKEQTELRRSAQRGIGERLRLNYEHLVIQELPPHMMLLLERLKPHDSTHREPSASDDVVDGRGQEPLFSV
jgi:hypothetical protein